MMKMSVPLMTAALLAACNGDPECGEGYQLLNGECVEVMTSDTDDTTAYPDPDTGDTGGEPCGCDVCEEGTADDPAYTSIQAAIDAASPGDTVTVCAGSYKELVALSAAVSVVGAGASTTTIDGDGDGTVLTITGSLDSTTVFSGFTLTDGDAYSAGGYGGGLYISESSPTLRDIVIRDSTATYGGGGVLLNASPTLDGLHIVDTTAEQEGGGLYINGGAAWIVRSVFEASYAREASALYVTDSAVRLENSIFFANQSALGSAVQITSGQSVTIANVVAALNTTGDDKVGCAIMAGSGSTMYNTAAYGNEGSGLCSDGTAAYNISYGNHEEDFILSGVPGPGEGDLSDDPQFIDPNLGDFTIRDTSPMIDAGNPDAAYNDADGSRADMGAYGGPEGDW